MEWAKERTEGGRWEKRRGDHEMRGEMSTEQKDKGKNEVGERKNVMREERIKLEKRKERQRRNERAK